MNEQTPNSIRIYNTAAAHVGENLCVDKELGCATTVNYIFEMALGAPIGGNASTMLMLPFLKDKMRFSETTPALALPGDVIISPTGSGNGKLDHGHVGIIAKYGILSNSSADGRLHEVYDIDTWTKYYNGVGGFPVRCFRCV